MNLLVPQPKLESSLEQLEDALSFHSEVDLAVLPEGYLNENVEQARESARRYRTNLAGGYRNLRERPKDRAILIDRGGDVVVDRPKYSSISVAEIEGLRIGHLLCDELVLQGVQGAEAADLDVLVHPIGVGMFSEEPFAE
ncbi:hypothetical protein [Cohnella zeiphila]|uniref:CN hydrolase domain-containing protein n=1 Tax=Cohnella zeiphila TaxID=2761120 RepID=A0A7X0SQS9_9BACL|nr:hypothetical protein [Cohnella zeiphila]MBB6733230.1 hypothetical protein [Cohnella zeiphila]